MLPEINETDRQAAEWAAKAGDGALPFEEQALLDEWLAQDERHVGAYVKALAIVTRIARVGQQLDLPDERHNRPVAWPSRRLVLSGSIAACLAAAIAFSALWSGLQKDVYSTALGESKIVALGDGSKITLNTNTRVEVRYSNSLRGIEIDRGEALFDVAKDKSKPFVVSAGQTRVLAVGTSFSVRLLPGRGLEVLVREGVVKIKTGEGQRSELLKATARAVVDHDGTIHEESLTALNVGRRLAWRYGEIFFQNKSLAAVASEYARYSATPIVVDDPSVAALTVSGLYRASDPAGFAKAAASSLGLMAEIEKDEIRIERKQR